MKQAPLLERIEVMKRLAVHERISEFFSTSRSSLIEHKAHILHVYGYPSRKKRDKLDTRVFSDLLVSPSWRIGREEEDGSAVSYAKGIGTIQQERSAWLEGMLKVFFPETTLMQYLSLREKCRRFEYSKKDYYGDKVLYAFEVLTRSEFEAVIDI